MKTLEIQAETPSSVLGHVVAGTVVQRASIGFFADVGLGTDAFVDIRYIPKDKDGKRRIPSMGEKVVGVVISCERNQARLSLLPEHLAKPSAFQAK